MNWRLDFVNQLSSAISAEEAIGCGTTIGKSLGFDYCAFGIQCATSASKVETGLFNNYPEKWRQRYVANNYLAVDPTVHHALSATTPLVWQEALFRQARPFWEDAKAHGLQIGWGMPTRGEAGAVGLVSFSRGHEQLGAGELDHIEIKLVYLAQLIHATVSKHWLRQAVPELFIKVTPREREVLLWTAEGKTIAETSKILSIADRTVQFHLYGLMKKLGVHNKSQLVLKAAMLGLLK